MGEMSKIIISDIGEMSKIIISSYLHQKPKYQTMHKQNSDRLATPNWLVQSLGGLASSVPSTSSFTNHFESIHRCDGQFYVSMCYVGYNLQLFIILGVAVKVNKN